MTATVIVRPEREKPILNRHPWVFSGAIHEVRGDPEPGDLVDVMSTSGRFLARGYFNPRSQIQVRLLTWEDEPLDDAWWRTRLKRALHARLDHRQQAQRDPLSAFRAVNAESDYLPGLIVDWYGQFAVLQALTLGIERRKSTLARLLAELHEEMQPNAPDVRLRGIYERSDVDARSKEGLKSHQGALWGEEPPQTVRIMEAGLAYEVDVRAGHKTGFYLDQRPNRLLLRDLLADAPHAAPHRTLNLFSYTGGFGIAALGADAPPGHVMNVDSSRDALEAAERNFHLNFAHRLDVDAHADFIQAEVFDLLHDFATDDQRFDAIICDPPKLAHNAGQVERAARGYKHLNLNCFKLMSPGGVLLTFSCSGAVDADLFQKIVFGALADSGRDAQVLRHLGAGDDHPVALTFPEGAYLKGLLLRVY